MGFLEKPKTEHELEHVRTDPAWIDARGVQSGGRDCLANMGIYLFKRNALMDVLSKTDYRDFGKEVFPASIRSRHVQVHLFDGYWEDIGTIKSFYQANLELTRPRAPFDLASAEAPIYSHARFLPPTRIDQATIRDSWWPTARRSSRGRSSKTASSACGAASVGTWSFATRS